MAHNNWRPLSISSIPMFETPKALVGGPIYQSTYTSDYQKRRSLENVDENSDDYLMGNKNLSESMYELSLMKANHAAKNHLSHSADPLAQPLYKTNKYGLLPIHRSKRIDGVNYFRSHMDPTAISEAKRQLESRSIYSLDFYTASSRKIPGYIKKDGYHHTNSERNVRYLKSYNGSLIPYIPSLPLNKKPLPPIRTDLTTHRFDNGEVTDGTLKHYEKISKSSQELDKYFNSLQYHQRDISPPA